MTLNVVPIAAGRAGLGPWGFVDLKGSPSTALRLTMSEDVELPVSVAADITSGVLLLNNDMGRLLFLPYSGNAALAYDLTSGTLLYPPVPLLRDLDSGMRMAAVRLVRGLGAIHLAESSLALFREDCTVAWLRSEDLRGWTFEGVLPDEILLIAGDWVGTEERQRRTTANGDPLN